MNKNTLIAVIAGLVVFCVTALGIAFIVAGGDNAAPAPTVTSQPAPAPSETSGGDEFILGIMKQTWDKTSYADQQSLCNLFNYAPDQAWEAFDSGSEHLVSRDVFDTFFAEKCSSIY